MKVAADRKQTLYANYAPQQKKGSNDLSSIMKDSSFNMIDPRSISMISKK